MPSETTLTEWAEPRRLPAHGAVVGRNPRLGASMVLAGLATQEPGIAIAGVGTLIVFVFQHLRKRWWFDGEAIHLREGWWSLNERSLGVDRIQQVDLREQLVARMFGLALVAVETASGAAGADIEIVLPEHEARRLRAELLRARDSADADQEVSRQHGHDRPPLAVLSAGDLVLAGVTGTETIAAVSATLAVLAPVWATVPDEQAVDFVDTVGVTAVAVLVAVAVLAVAAVGGIVRSVLAYSEFRLDVDGEEIRLRRGLLDRREESTPIHRVQVVSATATPIQRAIGRLAIQLRSAGRPGQQGAERLRIPLWPVADAARLVERLVPELGPALDAPLEAAPASARRRALVRGALLGSAAGLGVGSAVGAASSASAGAASGLILVVVGGLTGLASYRALGSALTERAFVSRHSPVVRRTDVVSAAKVQSTRVRSSPFQRRLGLATLHVDVAGGPSVKAPDRDETEAVELANLLAR